MFGVSWRREGETRWLRRTLVMRAVGRPRDTSLAQRNGVQRQLINITTQWGKTVEGRKRRRGKKNKVGWVCGVEKWKRKGKVRRKCDDDEKGSSVKRMSGESTGRTVHMQLGAPNNFRTCQLVCSSLHNQRAGVPPASSRGSLGRGSNRQDAASDWAGVCWAAGT